MLCLYHDSLSTMAISLHSNFSGSSLLKCCGVNSLWIVEYFVLQLLFVLKFVNADVQ